MPQFSKGQSGNPKGRPKKLVEDAKHSVLLDLFDEAAERDVILAAITRAKATTAMAASAANAASQWLWELKYGKTTDKVQSDNTQRIIVEYADDNPHTTEVTPRPAED